jgi:hypothetical protein
MAWITFGTDAIPGKDDPNTYLGGGSRMMVGTALLFIAATGIVGAAQLIGLNEARKLVTDEKHQPRKKR